MAANSFLLKGWSVTLVAALFALASKDTNQYFIYLAYFPCAVFWGLDGYFIRQERMYRELYQRIANLEPDQIDFDLNAAEYGTEVDSWWKTCITSTLLAFHGAVFGVIVFTMLVSINMG